MSQGSVGPPGDEGAVGLEGQQVGLAIILCERLGVSVLVFCLAKYENAITMLALHKIIASVCPSIFED